MMTAHTWLLDTRIDEHTGKDPHAPVLVMIHSLGSSLIMWDTLIDDLCATYRVIRVNLPGHGGSAPAPITEPLTMDALLDALERTLDSLGVERFSFAGLSIGGLIALAAAQRWGLGDHSRLVAVAAMASGPQNGTPDMWAERAALVRNTGTETLVEATMERWFSPAFHATHPDQVNRIRQVFIACSNEGYAQCCEILGTTDLRPGLADIAIPCAIVNGSEDAGFDDEAADALLAALTGPGPRTVLHCQDARHMCAMEKPAAVARLVTSLAH